VRERAADCSQWADSMSDAEAVYSIYDAAFAAAVRGDVGAGVCYAMAPWGFPESPVAQSDALKRQYIQNAKRFIERGVDSGNWTAVIAASNIIDLEHGPGTAVDWSPMEA